MNEIAVTRKAVQLQQWMEMVGARQNSGLTVKEWCAKEGLSENSYYYRLKVVRRELLQQMQPVEFARVPEAVQMSEEDDKTGKRPDPEDVRITIGTARIRMNSRIFIENARHLLEVMRDV